MLTICAGMFLPSAVAQLPVAPPAVPDIPKPDAPQLPATDAPVEGAEAQVDAQADVDAKVGEKQGVQADVQGSDDVQGQTSAKVGTEAKSTLDANVQSDLKAQTPAELNGKTGVDLSGQVDANVAGANPRASLGAEFASEAGSLRISQAAEGSAAARAGLQASDEIVAINGRRVSTAAELQTQLEANRNGPTTIHYWRDGTIQEAQVTLRSAIGTGQGQRVQSFYRGPDGTVPNAPVGIDSGYGHDRYYGPTRRHKRARRACRRR